MVPSGTPHVEVKRCVGRLVAQMTATAPSWAPSDIGPVIQALYPKLAKAVDAAGLTMVGQSMAWYEDGMDGQIIVHATFEIAERPITDVSGLGLEIVEIPAIAQAACVIHRGTMDNCQITHEALMTWVVENGLRAVGYSREVDIECGPDREWITELQVEVKRIEA